MIIDNVFEKCRLALQNDIFSWVLLVHADNMGITDYIMVQHYITDYSW